MTALEDMEGWHLVHLHHVVRFAWHPMVGTARNRQVHFAGRTEHDHCPHEQMFGMIGRCFVRDIEIHYAVQFDVDLLQFRRVFPVDFLARLNVDVEGERRFDAVEGGKLVPVLEL